MFLTGQAAALGLPRARPRRPRRLVPVRGEDGAAGRRAPLVHPRRRLRHHRAEAGGGGAAGGAEPALGGARHRRRAGGGAEPGGRASSASTGVRATSAATRSRRCAGATSGTCSRCRRRRERFQAAARGAPARASSATYESDWTARGRRPAPDRVVQHRAARRRAARRRTSSRPASTSPSGKRMETALLEISGREQRRIGQDLHDGLGQHLTGIAFMSKVLAAAARRGGRARRRRTRPRSCTAGERGDQQDARAGPRAAAGVLGRARA